MQKTNKELLTRISIDPEIQGGKPVIKGTRIPVSRVLGALSGGANYRELCEDYQLQTDDIAAAPAYAASLIDDTEFRLSLITV